MSLRQLATSLAAAGLLLGAASGAFAQAEEAPIVGRQLMTEQERDEYRAAMRSSKTEEERAAMREQHQKKMQNRARERGEELPDQPTPRGRGGQRQGGRR